GGADDPPPLVAKGRNGEGNREAAAIPRHAQGLVVSDPLATAEPRQDRGNVVFLFRRDENRNGLADRLLGRVPVHPLRTSIPAGDDPVQVLAQDGVVRRLDDRRQEPTRDAALSRRRLIGFDKLLASTR